MSNNQIMRRAAKAIAKTQQFLRVAGLPAELAAGKVVSFHGATALSSVFDLHVEIELPPLKMEPAIEALRCLDVSVALALDGVAGKERWFNGRVMHAQVSEVAGKKARPHLALELRPALWWLALEWDTRLFTDKDAKEIVDEILKAATPAVAFDWRLSSGRVFSKRPICRQYRQSSLHFVERLLAEEGVHYWFEFAKGMHRLILSDDPARLPTCPRGAPIPFDSRDGQEGVQKRKDRIFFLQRDSRVQATQYTVQARDAADPFACLEGSDKLACKAAGGIFDHASEAQSLDDCKASAARALRSLASRGSSIRGNGDVRDLCAGQTIAIATPRAARRCRLMSVQFEAVQQETLRYRNQFIAVPLDAPFAPERVQGKPLIAGLETAEVLSMPDKHGRVKVRFDLDRAAGTSAWIPVDREHDTWWTPRPGQRVLIDHIEGDPDRPIIERSIDQDETLPINPESHPRRGGITTPHHRLWFDDDDKLRRLLIDVGGDLVQQTTGDRHEITGGDLHSLIAGALMAKIGKALGLTIDGDATVQVGGSLSAKLGKALGLDAGDVIINAAQRLALIVNGNGIVIDASGVTIVGKKVYINPPGARMPGAPAAARATQPAETKIPARKPRKNGKK